ncbi:hypothetical protein ABN034_25560 [Actinopolymorpha sp. B11F2]|uniref:WXG100-like domain-containing protein n=1 Tax=Actinopolymorpha sp. B11F2 TaxID=3160862 RepID=UPI0032E43930
MGLELPPGLIQALHYAGCYWPEADETALQRCGEAWLGFAFSAEGSSEQAVLAVDGMARENEGPGIDAFEDYWEKVAGERGYLVSSEIVAIGIAVAFFQAAMLVLVLKLLVIVQLIALTIILAAAIAAAFFTVGASLAVAAEAAVTVNRVIVIAVQLTTTLVRTLGPVLARLVRDLLNEQVQRLDGRPIHASEHGVDAYETGEEREEAAHEYERRKQELAVDPAIGGTSPGTEREAEVALGLEATGTMSKPVTRADNERADFTEGSGQDWDVKGYQTREEPGRTYDRTRAETGIQKKLDRDIHVALDTSKLSREDFNDLKALVQSHPEWSGKVVIY